MIPGAYDPANYTDLKVSVEAKEMFEYIVRWVPKQVDLDTKVKVNYHFSKYIPSVGLPDLSLKMPKPDGSKEDLGITVLDEPALNQSEKELTLKIVDQNVDMDRKDEIITQIKKYLDPKLE